ncbi:serine hydrolase domain-containing protein [Pseudoalteromonas luteoviolacea]|uniref:serine hydrolase domain-containing protein n=1 Tax=Pseudoalteromonas luteoviolacea TaxID=43657 RepID=UPI001154D2DF|nr:serine hydrolase domain-containing protein [Pseudoalteromonas luteoviolacea]TQF70735.1 beta-lactamase family protein [Pseudoalteromonas luteoviolacea]
MNKLILLVCLMTTTNVLASKENAFDELSTTLESMRSKNDIPSMSVAIITSGKVAYLNGFGYVDKEQKAVTNSESLFRVASITKLFTAQAIMQLADKKKIDLNAKIGRYLPSFRDSNITIYQLLTHTSGLGDVIKPISYENKRTISSYLETVKNASKKNIGNKSFKYSDTNYNILGAIISAASEKNYETYIYQHILAPAKMSQSGFFNGNNVSFPHARPTYKGQVIEESKRRPFDPSFNPSEGLISNVNDLSQWLVLTLNRDSSLLKKQTFIDMLKPRVKTTWGEIYIGLGWQIYSESNDKIARHPGSIRGYKSLIITHPNSKNALILLTNSSNTPRWEIAKSITKILKQNNEWQ